MGKRRGGYLGGSTVIGPNSPLMGGKPRQKRAPSMPPPKSGWGDVDALFKELGGMGPAAEKVKQKAEPPVPTTFGELRRMRQLLEVGCPNCGRVVFLDPGTLPFADAAEVHTAHRRMTCTGCDEKAGYSRAAVRTKTNESRPERGSD